MAEREGEPPSLFYVLDPDMSDPLMGNIKESKARVAVLGASGYTGGELLRLLAHHPRMIVTLATADKSAGQSVHSIFPHLSGTFDRGMTFESLTPANIADRADAVFLALPHTKSFEPVKACLSAGIPVVDLSADYRLKDPRAYDAWYNATHPYPDLLAQAVYGLPELHRVEIARARLVASPGCYPTAAILQLAPLIAHGLAEPDSIVIDAKSGISGAGRSASLPYHFPEAHESLEAYKIGRHRHTPEIEQELARLMSSTSQSANPFQSRRLHVMFTPHLVPMNRGILSTSYCRLTRPLSLADVRALYIDYYKDAPFIRIKDPDLSANPGQVRGSNFCDVAVFPDSRSNWLVTTAALDNLVKGAAGQAIQALNLMLGFPEDLGLTGTPVFP